MAQLQEKDSLLLTETIHESFQQNPQNRFKILSGLYRGSYWRLVLSGVFYTIKHLPAWVLPLSTAAIINAATRKDPATPQIILFHFLLMLVLITQNVLTNQLYTVMHTTAIRRVESGLRASLIQKLQVLSFTFQKQMQTGRLQSKIMRDVENVQQLSSQLFVTGLNVLVNMAVALGITFAKSRTVFVFFLITVPLASMIVVFFRKKISENNAAFRVEMEQTSGKVVEMISLAPVTRAHALEEMETERLNRHFFRIAEKGIRLDLVQALFGAMNWAGFQAFQLICLAFTGYLAFQGKISPGDVVIYQSYFTMVVNTVSGIVTMVPAITKGMESVSSIGEILSAGETEQNEGKTSVKNVQGAFRFEDVHYRYPDSDTEILQGITMEVSPGETIAFVGESGSGKTTLLNLLIGFLNPVNGRILLDGQDMTEIDLRSYRKHLAVVPQQTILFDGSIRENITYGAPNVTEEHLEIILHAANLWEMVQALPEGLETQIGEHGDKLSGGQRQRIAIARALIRNPQVILLDEATSALDVQSERKIQDALRTLCKNRTAFIVAHRLSTIRSADKIAVIEQGRCAEFGNFDELMAQKGIFYRMQTLQNGSASHEGKGES